MEDFYAEMADVAREILAPTRNGGLGQGSIALVQYINGPAPANPWDPPAPPSRQVTPLDGVARGVAKELVGLPVATGGQVIASDKQVIVAPWGGSYEPGQLLELDGSPATILKVENIPAIGTTCAIRFVVRQ